MAKESGIAKSTGRQTEEDIKPEDQLLYNYLKTGKKVSKSEAGYREQQQLLQQQNDHPSQKGREQQPSCGKCKFNLPAEHICHIVEGKVNNERGISERFSPKGHGMLPGYIVWEYVKKGGEKLDYNTGLVIKEATEGFRCKGCKHYMYSHRCLLLKGRLEPEMSCAFIVKTGNGIEV